MATSAAAIRRKVQRRFKMRGLTLKVESLEEALSFLSRFPDAEDEALELLLDEIDRDALKSPVLDGEAVRKVVSLLLEADSAVEPEDAAGSGGRMGLRVVDAFLIPKFLYDPIKKIFYEHTEQLPLHGDASAKAALYRNRFQVLMQRILRDEYFSRPIFDAEMTGRTEITPIQSLIGCAGRRWIMGVISQLEDGYFFLEDLSGTVPVDLSSAKITSGFFTENTIIVAEGEMLISGTFQVSTCGFPPLEDRELSLSQFMGLDYFGTGKLSTEETLRLSGLEKQAVNDMFVIFSDVWLDDNKTMEKLAVILDSYDSQDVVPSLFVFMGNFCSRPCNLSFNSYLSLRGCFGKLGEMIAACQKLKEQSRFMFIPGPDDAGPSTVLPRCALPKYLTEELQKHVSHAIFSSNPCRVKFYTQEIVLFRKDLLYSMHRSCLIPHSLEETDNLFAHLVATITHQSHLCPLPLTVQPIIWNYDHCLQLYPTPHTIVLGDRSEQESFQQKGITCFNPGPFSMDYTFAAYRPCDQQVELCDLK